MQYQEGRHTYARQKVSQRNMFNSNKRCACFYTQYLISTMKVLVDPFFFLRSSCELIKDDTMPNEEKKKSCFARYSNKGRI